MPTKGETIDDELELLGDANTEGDEDAAGGYDNFSDEAEFVDPEIESAVRKLLEKRERELADAIARGDTKNGVYKGLQRHLSAREKKIASLEAQLAQAMAQLEQYQALAEELTEGLNWASNTMLESLPDDIRQTAMADLQARRAKLAEGRLARKLQASTFAPPAQAGTGDVPDYVREGRKRFLEMSRNLAKRFGVDPDDPRLDYGDDDDSFVVRYEKFNQSLQELLGADDMEQRVANVRQRTQPVLTRSGSGGGASVGPRRMSLEEATRQVLHELRRRDFGR